MNPKEAITLGVSIGKSWMFQIATEIDMERKVKLVEESRRRMVKKTSKMGVYLTDGQREILNKTDPTIRYIHELDELHSIEAAKRLESSPIPTPKSQSATVLLARSEENLKSLYKNRERVRNQRKKIMEATRMYFAELFRPSK